MTAVQVNGETVEDVRLMNRYGWLRVAVVLIGLWSASVGAEERKLILSIGAGEKYNDNIFFSYDDEIDDYVTTLLGGLKFVNRSERLDMSLSGRVENQDYAENDDLDGFDQFYKARFGYLLTPKLRAVLDAGYSRDSQPDRDIDVTGMVLGSATRETFKGGLSTKYALNEITSVALSYKYREQTYDNPEFVDYTYHQGGLGFDRKLDKYFDNTTGRLYFNYAHYDYPQIQIDYYSGTIGFLRRLTELWYLQLDVGARYTESEFKAFADSRINEGWGGVGVLEFGYQGERGATSLTVSHDVGAASGVDGSVERTSVAMDVSYRVLEKSRVGVSGEYFLNKSDAGDLAPQETDERTLNVRPYLRLSLIDDFALVVSYTYTQNEDQTIEETRERNIYLARIVWDFPVVE
jgi:hypothetical protein